MAPALLGKPAELHQSTRGGVFRGSSGVWLVILALISAGFLHQLESQDRKLDLLLERLEPTVINP